MVDTSALYQEQINAPVRSSKALIILDLLGEDVEAVAAASSTAVGSDPANLLLGRMSFDDATYEGDHLPEYLQGSFLGWQSGVTSGAEGLLNTPEIITFTYNNIHTSENFWVVGTFEEYPVDFTFRIYNETNALTFEQVVTGNTRHIWNPVLEPVICKKVEIEITRISLADRPVTLMTAGLVSKLVLIDNEISDFDLLEELTSDESLPYGGVSSNSFSFSIHNPAYLFTPSNRKSPFNGLLRPDIPVTGFYGLEVEDDKYEFLPLGQYKVSEWRAPSQSLEASITAYDKLFELQDEPVPMLRIIENATVGDIFNALFIGMGLSEDEYVIESLVDTSVPYGYVVGSTFGEALFKLSQVGICQVGIDRSNRLVVRSSVPRIENPVQWSDDNQILFIENPEKFNAVFRNVIVVVHLPSLRRTLELTSTTPISLASGNTLIESVSFSQTPVLLLEQMSIEGAVRSHITQLDYGSHDTTVFINNPGPVEDVSFRAEGIYVKYVKSEINELIPRSQSNRVLRIENELIQTVEQAKAVLDRVVPAVSSPFNYFEMDVRGNPALEVGDIIEIHAPTINIDPTLVEIYRQTIRYDGALSATAVARIVQ